MHDRESVSPVSTSRAKRAILFTVGSIFLAAGLVGIVVPVLPTTPFLILTAACYARSSARCHRWLVTNRVFGRYLNDYLCGRGVSWRVRAGALVFLWTMIVLSVVFFVDSTWLRVLLLVIAVGVTVHVSMLKGRGVGR